MSETTYYCNCAADGIWNPASHAPDCPISQLAPPTREAAIAARQREIMKIVERYVYAVPQMAGIAAPLAGAIEDAIRNAEAPLLAQLQQARQERDTEQQARLTEVEHWVGRYNEVEAWRVDLSVKLRTTEAALQQAREALKEAEAQKTVAQKRLTKYLQDEGR